MSYIGNPLITAAFVTDQFSGTGSQTVYTMSVAPANGAAAIVAVSGVLQDPSTYSVNGTTLTFSAAPPSGTGNISVRYLGIPASGVTTTAYRTVTEFTATAGQTVFTPPSYVAGFLDVYRNGVKLAAADFTATNGTTVTLTSAATAGDIVTTVSFQVSSVINAIPATAGAVNNTYLGTGAVLAANMGSNGTWAPTGTVLQVVNSSITSPVTTTSTSFVTTGHTVTITPKFSTSKILVMVSAIFGNYGAYNTALTLYRNGTTNLATGGATPCLMDGRVITTSQQWYMGGSFNFYDSPATTSSTTYTVYYLTDTSSTAVYAGAPGVPSNSVASIIALEIAG